MATRRVMRSVLHNFLDSYTSRYSDYRGYWLFGFLVEQLCELKCDLLAPGISAGDAPKILAIDLGKRIFTDQREKAGLRLSQVREASLALTRLPTKVQGQVNFQVCSGYNLVFRVQAVMDNGRNFTAERAVFVAPHNPANEYRSSRAEEQ